jgi:hypothetical protein
MKVLGVVALAAALCGCAIQRAQVALTEKAVENICTTWLSRLAFYALSGNGTHGFSTQ